MLSWHLLASAALRCPWRAQKRPRQSSAPATVAALVQKQPTQGAFLTNGYLSSWNVAVCSPALSHLPRTHFISDVCLALALPLEEVVLERSQGAWDIA